MAGLDRQQNGSVCMWQG